MKISLVLEMDFLSVRLFSNKTSFPDCCVEYGCTFEERTVLCLLFVGSHLESRFEDYRPHSGLFLGESVLKINKKNLWGYLRQ